jgi:hypothetical protein
MKFVMKRRMPGITFLTLALSLAFAAGCSKNENTGNSGNSGNANAAGANRTATAPPSGAVTASAGSPMAALKAYYEAANRKDIATAKKYLSAGTMRLMEEGAKRMGKSVDEAMKEGALQSPPVVPELSNEKITGDTATVDIKAEGQTISMPMVKEDGEWKLAMDKLLENMKNQMGGAAEQPKGPATSTDDEDEHDGGH